jgi:hypothetical protein
MRYLDLSTNPELDPSDPENYDSLPETYDPDAYWGDDTIDTWPEDDWAL